MTHFVLLLLAAAIAHTLARATRAPATPLLVGAGIALGATGLLGDKSSIVRDALLLGAMFLVFFTGTELDPKRVGTQRNLALRVGVLQFFSFGALGFVLSRLLAFDTMAALQMAVALAASSTLVVVRVLQRQQRFYEPVGRLVLGVLLVQDILVILMAAALTAAAQGPVGMLVALGKLLALIALTGVLVRWVTPYVVLKLNLDEESLLLVVLAMLFAFIGAARALELPLVVGAFLAGVSLSIFPINGLLRGLLSSLGDFFLAIFFVALGATLALPGPRELLLTVVLSLSVLMLTPILVAALLERAGLTARSGLDAGVMLSQTSELSLIVGLLAAERGLIEERTLSVIALVTVLTMMATPFLATDRVVWRLLRWHPSRRRARAPVPRAHEAHILLLGCGERGHALLDVLLAKDADVVVVDDDPAVVDELESRGVSALRGDGADIHVLEAAGARRARLVVSTLRRPADAVHVLSLLGDVPAYVRVFDDEDAERIRNEGGIPVLESEATAERFARWYADHATPSRTPPA